MKTAIEQLIEELIECKKLESNLFIVSTISLITSMAENKLETEKQQIIEAYNDGFEYGFNNFGHNGEEYYENTFKNDEINF